MTDTHWLTYMEDDIEVTQTKAAALRWIDATTSVRMRDGWYRAYDRYGYLCDIVRSDLMDTYNVGCL